jgi:transcriptional antiterminator RfaH
VGDRWNLNVQDESCNRGLCLSLCRSGFRILRTLDSNSFDCDKVGDKVDDKVGGKERVKWEIRARASLCFPPPPSPRYPSLMSSCFSSSALKTKPAPASLDWAWFCLRAQQKHEQVAAGFLRQSEQIEVFNPCIRFVQARRQRKVWITEPLFPGYLFARFNWKDSLARVQYALGVQSVVHFGNGWPTVPDRVIADLRAAIGPAELRVIPDQPTPGDEVEIIADLFQGLKAVVTQVMPARQRVAVLLDFLGRQTTVEISAHYIVRQGMRR